MAWNRSDNTGSVPVNPRAKGALAGGGRKLLLAAAVVAALCAAVVVLWVGRSRAPTPDDDGQPSRIKSSKPSLIAETPAVTNKLANGGAALANAAEGAEEELPPEPPKEEKKPGVFAPGMIRLPNGYELRFKLPAEGETRQLLAGGEIWEIDSKGNIENVTPPPIFEKPFEGMISSLYERDGMVLPFALKGYSEEDVRRMCKEPTLSYDDDTPEITMKRENVAMLKKAILEFMDGGGKFEEFVDDMLQHSQKAQAAQIEGVHGVRDLLLAGKNEEAVQYYRLFSQDMSDKGYGELKLPRSYHAALEEIAAKGKGGNGK